MLHSAAGSKAESVKDVQGRTLGSLEPIAEAIFHSHHIEYFFSKQVTGATEENYRKCKYVKIKVNVYGYSSINLYIATLKCFTTLKITPFINEIVSP